MIASAESTGRPGTAPQEHIQGRIRERIIDIEDLHVRFVGHDHSIYAVNGVSFGLDRGEVLCLLGESGSGKSVTLRAAMRLLPHDQTVIDGRIEFGGRNLLEMTETELERLRGTAISMIFQEPMTAFDPVYTVGRQIEETVITHDGVDRRTARARALELLEMVRIPSPAQRLDAYPHEMSGGMRQRAMIALALSCRPDVLLADEPTTALDVTVQIQILLLLRELQRDLGMAVVFVSHDVGVAAEIADRIAVMYGGRIVETGSASAVLKRRRHPYTEGLLASTVVGSRRGQRLTAIPGSPPHLTAPPVGCTFAPRCSHVTAECHTAPPEERVVGPGHTMKCIRATEPE